METQVKGLDYNFAELYPNKKALSSSQFRTYVTDPALFYTEYVLGVRKPQTAPMLWGSVFSAYFADRTMDYVKVMKDLKIFTPRQISLMGERMAYMPVIPPKLCEYPLRVKYKGWWLRGTLDAYPEPGRIWENKTGGRDWTQEQVDNSVQLDFYTALYYLKFKKMPEQIDLYWIPTVNRPKPYYHFSTTRTVERIEALLDLVALAIKNLEAENFTRNFDPEYDYYLDY